MTEGYVGNETIELPSDGRQVISCTSKAGATTREQRGCACPRFDGPRLCPYRGHVIKKTHPALRNGGEPTKSGVTSPVVRPRLG